MAPTTWDLSPDITNYCDTEGSSHVDSSLEDSRWGKRCGELCDFPNCTFVAKGTCPSCKLAGYCSDYHRRGNWDVHKISCSMKFAKESPSLIALRMETDVVRNSGGSSTSLSSSGLEDVCYKRIVAKTSIKSGSRLMFEEPAVSFPNFEYALPCSRNMRTTVVGMTHFVAPTEEFKEYYYSELLDPVANFYPSPKVAQVCFGCYKVVKDGLPWDCQFCGVPLCSQACEDNDEHKLQECGTIQDMNIRAGFIHRNVEALYLDVATLRTLMLKIKCSQKFGRIFDLVNHPRVENYRNSARFGIQLKSDHVPLVLPLSIKFGIDPEFVVSVCCIVDALSGVYSSDSTKKSLYPFCASLMHSCIPNCLFTPYFKDFEPTSKIVLMAAVDIKEGETLTIDVLNKPLYISRQDRKTLLRRKCVFTCGCPFCSDPTDLTTFLNALRCNRCSDYILTSDPDHFERTPWKCQKCGESISWNEVQKRVQEWREAIKSLDIQYDNLGKFTVLKRKLMQHFHPNHYLILTVEGIQAKLALGPNGHAWGGMKVLKHDPMWLDVTTLKEYCYIRQYCYQILRFLRVGNAVERAIMLSQLFYIEFLLALRKLHSSNLNLNMELVNFRMQLAKLRESSDIFLKHFHPSRHFVGNKTKASLEMFDNAFILYQIFNRRHRRGKKGRAWAGSSLGEGQIPPVQFDKILKPILEYFLTPDPVNENLLV